jgi:hypothetical protein
MPSKPRLPLKTSPRVKVFRLIDQTLRNDPTLRNVVGFWQSWEGDPTRDGTPLPLNRGVAIQLRPLPGREGFWAVNSMSCDLVIGVEMVVPGTCYDDIDNLWHAVELVLFPPPKPDHNALIAKLQQAGARKGVAIGFQPPGLLAQENDAGEPCMRALGRITIEVQNDFNP